MAKLDARWISLDAQSMVAGTSNVLQVKLVTQGGLERTANGLQIKAAEVTSAMLAGSIAFEKLADYSNIARLDQTETVAAVWAFGSNIPTVSADPTTANQVTRKSYVDALYNGLKWKAPVRAMAVANLTLSGVQTIDSVSTLVAGDRILLTAQNTASQNGIWLMNASSWTRPDDFPVGGSGSSVAVHVAEGTVYKDTAWFCTTDAAADVIGTNNLTWAQNAGASLTAGNGLVLNGNAMDVNPGQGIELSGDVVKVKLDGSSLGLSANGLCVASGGVTFGMIASAAIGTSGTTIAAGDHDHGAAGAAASQYWGTNGSNVLGWYALPAQTTGGRLIQKFTLSATNITNKYVTLSGAPSTAAEVILLIKGAGNQFYGDDYAMDGGTPARLSWDSLALDGVLAEGDKLTVIYN
jgi:hypothetical protein